jgi:hypothetical protein
MWKNDGGKDTPGGKGTTENGGSRGKGVQEALSKESEYREGRTNSGFKE